jgi:hypothetical protein
MSDDLEGFVDRVGDRVGHAERAAVDEAVRTTLGTLGGHLGGVPPALHDALPRALRSEVAAGMGSEPLRPAALYQQVAEQTGLRVGVALELVQSTMAELAARLPEAARDVLRASLPPSWAALVPSSRERSRPMAAAKPAEPGHTLATGRPGGARPLADAAPTAGQADSIATSDDPHGDRLASAHGPGPHDDAHTLAHGRPGSRQPLADSD